VIPVVPVKGDATENYKFMIRQALQASEGIPGLSAAMRGLVAARAAVLAAVVAIV
jgi:hypothetical protein